MHFPEIRYKQVRYFIRLSHLKVLFTKSLVVYCLRYFDIFCLYTMRLKNHRNFSSLILKRCLRNCLNSCACLKNKIREATILLKPFAFSQSPSRSSAPVTEHKYSTRSKATSRSEESSTIDPGPSSVTVTQQEVGKPETNHAPGTRNLLCSKLYNTQNTNAECIRQLRVYQEPKCSNLEIFWLIL